jgi:histidine triad (HIT) family protein
VSGNGPSDPTCAFCAIAGGRDESVEVVCEGKAWIAFFPLEPATPGHTLIIPRAHVADLWHAPLSLAADLMEGVMKVGTAIEEASHPEGMNLITSAGKVAEQTIFHLHLHVVPRWSRDGFGPIWPREGERYADEQLEAAARRIREKCSQIA